MPNAANAFPLRQKIGDAAGAIALVAAAFSLTIALLLLANHARFTRAQPLDSPALLQLREQARKDPKQLEWVERFRDMDEIARHSFFASQGFSRAGAALLLAGIATLAVALRLRRAMAPPPPDPTTLPPQPDVERITTRRRAALAILVVSLCALGAWIAWAFAPHSTPPIAAATAAPAAPSPTPAPAPDLSAEWPSMRGPGGIGVATKATPPTDWDGASGRNIIWKTEVPMPGVSTPALADGRIFLTAADEHSRKVFCFDAADGRLLWTHDLQPMQGTPTESPQTSEDTGQAASSPATDGARTFAIFANGDLVCVDRDGKKVWGVNLGVPDNPYGHASSLIVWRNLLVVQYDHHGEAFIAAFESATGRVAWETKRKVEASWTTPAIIDLPDRQILITASTPLVIAYDPASGRELWSRDVLSGELAPSPAFADGRVFVNDDGGRVFAFDPASGEPAWEADANTPDICSPVAFGKFIWLPNSAATVVCCDTATGKQVSETELDEGFCASPIAAAGKIYTFDRNGTAFLFDAADPAAKPIRLELGEKVFATPAFVKDRIYVRAEKHLICIGAKP